ncbi:hypothetical protein MB818_04165 [Ruegeria sp. 1NDH52C]|uniref:HEPN AbiU2-like domain-containing protein n=1 Tax=Ruegeria alba TaxID=2916756 RepID=A0ABS9NT32_9RHOB|nr:hypothetical protein [Ruegeria alba]MCG6557378.1 hypothetical protein [Ruegeria alba]
MATLIVYNEGVHFTGCLQMVDHHLRQKLKDENSVRWIVVGLHDALYAILIEKLTRTDGFGVFNDKFEAEAYKFYGTGQASSSPDFEALCEKSSKENLAGIGKLLERANLGSNARVRASNIDSLERPSRGVSHLKKMRDFLAHPRPMLSGYYESWLLETLDDTLSVIKEVLQMPSSRSTRHDPREAEVLLSSIAYYLSVWRARACSVREK